jgi:ABC-type sugar transport system permease subunit
MQDNAPYNPQAHFYSDPYEKYLRWQQKKENVLKYVKKTLKWVFIIAVPLCFLVLFIWALFTNHNNVYPVKTSSGVLGGYGIFTPLIHALQDFF